MEEKWAAKHKYEELKEGVWLEPTLALLRRGIKEEWRDKHRNVARKLVMEGVWVHKRLFDIGWSNENKRQGCRRRHREAQALPLPMLERSQTSGSRSFQEVRVEGEDIRESQ